jgi:hypothetical protein
MPVYDNFYKRPYSTGNAFALSSLSNITAKTLQDYDVPLHQNIRNFSTSVVPVDVSLLDLAYHSVGYLKGIPVGQLDSSFVSPPGAEKWFGGGLNQSALDALQQETLDGYTQYDIENAAGIGIKSSLGYSNGLEISFTSNQSKLYSSTYQVDNLTAAPFDEAGTYYIELILHDFPAQAEASKYNLATSYISFSSSLENDPSVTDTFNLDDSLLSLNAGGDVVWRINRNSITNADISAIRRIDFFIQAIGTPTPFIAQALRLVKSDYPYYNIGINTKTGRLQKNPNQTGGNGSAPPHPIMNIGTHKGKNFSEIVNFNSGQGPSAPNYNEFSVFLRSQQTLGDYVQVRGQFNEDETIISIYNGATNVRKYTTVPLLDNTEYFLQVDVIDDKLRVLLWESKYKQAYTVFFNSQEDSNPVYVLEQRPGFVAIEFKPHYYSFTIDYMFSREAIYGEFVSNIFNTITPVVGASLYANSSPPRSLIINQGDISEGNAVNRFHRSYFESGRDNGGFNIVAGTNDVSVSIDPDLSLNNKPSYRVRKHLKNAIISGIQWDETIRITDPLNASITGNIRFDIPFSRNGFFRVVLFDKYYDNVLFMSNIEVSRAPNRWHEFFIPITTDRFYNLEFKVQLQHFGLDETKNASSNTDFGNFWINDFKVQTETVVWEATNEPTKQDFVPFYDTINKEFEGINFLNGKREIQVRGRAFHPTAWINRYELTPRYAEAGLLLEPEIYDLTYENLPETVEEILEIEAPDYADYVDVEDAFDTYADLG